MRIPLLVLTLLVTAPVVAWSQIDGGTGGGSGPKRGRPGAGTVQRTGAGQTIDVTAARQTSDALRSTIATFDDLIDDPAPANLDRRARNEYQQQTRALTGTRNRLASHLAERDRVLGSTPQPEAMAAMNMQFLALQNAIQMESLKVPQSGPAQARHDIAMNAIRGLPE